MMGRRREAHCSSGRISHDRLELFPQIPDGLEACPYGRDGLDVPVELVDVGDAASEVLGDEDGVSRRDEDGGRDVPLLSPQ